MLARARDRGYVCILMRRTETEDVVKITFRKIISVTFLVNLNHQCPCAPYLSWLLKGIATQILPSRGNELGPYNGQTSRVARADHLWEEVIWVSESQEHQLFSHSESALRFLIHVGGKMFKQLFYFLIFNKTTEVDSMITFNSMTSGTPPPVLGNFPLTGL